MIQPRDRGTLSFFLYFFPIKTVWIHSTLWFFGGRRITPSSRWQEIHQSKPLSRWETQYYVPVVPVPVVLVTGSFINCTSCLLSCFACYIIFEVRALACLLCCCCRAVTSEHTLPQAGGQACSPGSPTPPLPCAQERSLAQVSQLGVTAAQRGREKKVYLESHVYTA